MPVLHLGLSGAGRTFPVLTRLGTCRNAVHSPKAADVRAGGACLDHQCLSPTAACAVGCSTRFDARLQEITFNTGGSCLLATVC